MPAIGKSKAKVYSKANTTKKEARGEVGRGPMTEKRKREKKKYADKLSDTQRAKAKKAMTSDKAYSFKEAFAKARGGGSDRFTFKGKSYLTKKPSELKKKGNIFQKFTKKMRGTNPDGSTRTQAEYEAAVTKRKKETRIARIEKRKGEGKSYSAKNLASLKGSEKKPTYITKKKKPSYSISS
tara:strand:- start:63 stop:608 length:546 start_codon:yes stop_codon:yes gene_type:complete